MKALILVHVITIFLISHSAYGSTIFTVMTLNTWHGGQYIANGPEKIIKHINAINPHMVGLQETQIGLADLIVSRLNYQHSNSGDTDAIWRRCQFGYSSATTHIITRLPIVIEHWPSDQLYSAGCRIQVRPSPPHYVDVWNVHLHWTDYGPYTACQSDLAQYHPNIQEILLINEHQHAGRFANILEFVKHHPVASQLARPWGSIILMGDFNAPSHLDWTDQTKYAHCNVSFQWPVSKFVHAYGFRDSYRYMNPDPVRMPGNTWSPIYKTSGWQRNDWTTQPEPQDRIDFIYYRGLSLRPISSRIYHGTSRIISWPYHYYNDWPSDHSAVITDFMLDE